MLRPMHRGRGNFFIRSKTLLFFGLYLFEEKFCANPKIIEIRCA